MKLPRLCLFSLLLGPACCAWAQTKPKKKAPPTPYQLLQGKWYGGEDEGFEVKGSRTSSFLHPTPSVPFRLVGDSLFWHYSKQLVTRNRVLKLDRNNLVIRFEDGTERRYYRCK